MAKETKIKKPIIIIKYDYEGYESITRSMWYGSVGLMKDGLEDIGLKGTHKPGKFGSGKFVIKIPKGKNYTKEQIIKAMGSAQEPGYDYSPSEDYEFE